MQLRELPPSPSQGEQGKESTEAAAPTGSSQAHLQAPTTTVQGTCKRREPAFRSSTAVAGSQAPHTVEPSDDNGLLARSFDEETGFMAIARLLGLHAPAAAAEAPATDEHNGSAAAASATAGAGVEPHFFCQICLAHARVGGADSHALAGCGHRYCRTCIAAYVAAKVVDGQVYPNCFHITEPRSVAVTAGGGDDPSQGDTSAASTAVVTAATAAAAAEVAAAAAAAAATDGDGGGSGGAALGTCGHAISDADMLELLGGDAALVHKFHWFRLSKANA
jgi:Zinc finger, C3HC4 type (RING finger)